jgi:hypothetical protein
MNPEEKIRSAEINYRHILEEYFTAAWGETILYSHDIDHHRRVWYYAKELLTEISAAGEDIDPGLPRKLIIASYLHDLGMSIDPGIRHGILSRELGKSFLKTNNLHESEYFDVLNAIEHHDDKEYKTPGSTNNQLLRILSAADDLDAFGFIGIYRYLEIYLVRGIQPEIVGYEIRENALKRYQNLEATFGNHAGLIERHRKRFLLLDDFLTKYNRQIEDFPFNQKNSLDYVNIIDFITWMIHDKIPPFKIESEYYGFSSDQAINNFIGQLSSELREFINS